ncbi:MAG: sugar transferase [Bacteroidales bacterium]|nr:sugar transferase [Bacteroidales bacterium]
MKINWFPRFLTDFLLVTLAYIMAVWLKPGPSYHYLYKYLNSFLVFLGIWVVISALFGKQRLENHEKISIFIRQVLFSNIVIFSLVSGLMFLIRQDYYSRFIVIGTVAIATAAELLVGSVWYAFVHAQLRHENGQMNGYPRNGNNNGNMTTAKRQARGKPLSQYRTQARQNALLLETSKPVFDYIFQYAPIDSPKTLIVSTSSRFNIEMLAQNGFNAIVNLERINDVRYLNKFFEAVNEKLPVGGIYVDYVETKDQRKNRILNKYPPVVNWLYYMADFMVKRVFPKFAPTKGIYFFLTRGQNRVLSKAETYGRLCSCGFHIEDERFINGYLYFVARKVKEPLYPVDPSYGPIVALDRIGKEGKPIRVYKMRTMHPFAEYLQEYMYNSSGLDKGGKFKDDFRISTLGKILRIFWLDEVPMLVNFIRGEMKLFGVRPLSRQYFELYTPELQQKRIRYKPGMIPPYYVDMPKTLEEIIASEMKYLNAYEKNPFFTDFRYFWKAMYNIVVKRARSR